MLHDAMAFAVYRSPELFSGISSQKNFLGTLRLVYVLTTPPAVGRMTLDLDCESLLPQTEPRLFWKPAADISSMPAGLQSWLVSASKDALTHITRLQADGLQGIKILPMLPWEQPHSSSAIQEKKARRMGLLSNSNSDSQIMTLPRAG